MAACPLVRRLGRIGKVEIFEFRFGGCRLNIAGQTIGQLTLALDLVEDGLAPIIKCAQVVQSFIECAQMVVGQAASPFLAVTGDEMAPWRLRPGGQSRLLRRSP